MNYAPKKALFGNVGPSYLFTSLPLILKVKRETPSSFCLKIYVIIVIHVYRVSQNLNIFSHYSLLTCIFSEDQRKVKYFSKATNGILIPKMLHNSAFLPNIRERKKCQEIVSLKYKHYVIMK